MMGSKARIFGPLEQVSLEDLIPKDHFYRHVERTLDLSFVRVLVKRCYAPIGRPSVAYGAKKASEAFDAMQHAGNSREAH